MTVYLFPSGKPLRDITEVEALIDFLADLHRDSLPQVFTYRANLERIDQMIRDFREDGYHLPFAATTDELAFNVMASADAESVRCSERLIDLFGKVHFATQVHGRLLNLHEFVILAFKTLKATDAVRFIKADKAVLVRSLPKFEATFATRLDVSVSTAYDRYE